MVAENIKRSKDDNFYGFVRYAREIVDARIDGKAKSLLWFYAWAYNWTEKRRSFWPEKKICAHVGMSVATMHKHRKYLEKLGWIEVVKVHYLLPPLIGVKVGKNDPDYELHAYANSSEDDLSPLKLASLESDELKQYLLGKDFKL